MENKLLIANMKMYMNITDVKDYLSKVQDKISNNVIICPTNIYIPYFLEKNYNIGIQNVFYEDNGAYTGEVSIQQVKSMNIDYVIVGHSERRKYFNENDYDINKKVIKCLENNLKVILCIGENIEDENSNITSDILKKQLEIALNNVDNKYQDNIIIAYEPRWAIGTGKVPSNIDITNTVNYIKTIVNMNIKVVYGGSVNENNINILNKINNVDGFLIGGACTNPEKFLSIINACCNN